MRSSELSHFKCGSLGAQIGGNPRGDLHTEPNQAAAIDDEQLVKQYVGRPHTLLEIARETGSRTLIGLARELMHGLPTKRER